MLQSLFTWYLAEMSKVERKGANLLGKVGHFSARRPWLTILVSFAFCPLCMAGLANFDFETRSEKLWVDQHSQVKQDLNEFRRTFDLGRKLLQDFVIEAAEPDGNILTREVFLEAFNIIDKFLATGSEEGSPSAADFCTPADTRDCFVGALAFFHSNRAVLEAQAPNDTALRQAVSALTYPGSMARVMQKTLFASPVFDENGTLVSAKAFRMAFASDKGDSADMKAFLRKVEERFVDPYIRRVEQSYPAVRLHMQGMYSVDDELGRVVWRDSFLFALAFILMSLFAAALLGKATSCVGGRRLLGSLDIILVVIGTAAGYGIAMAMGIPFTILAQVLPFILVGVGMDDAFVIAGAFDRTSSKDPLEVRMQNAMERVGMSVTLTTLTDTCAFGLGCTATFPAVSYFCAYAALACIFIWLLHVTAFCALLALDVKRQQAGRLDGLCCVSWQPPSSPQGGRQPAGEAVQRSPVSRAMRAYARLLLANTATKVGVILFFLFVAIFSIVQASKGLGTNFDVIDLTGDSSYIRDLLDAEKRLWGTDSSGQAMPVMLTYNDLDFSSIAVQRAMQAANRDFIQLESVNAEPDFTVDWYGAFMAWAQSPAGPPGNEAWVDVATPGCDATPQCAVSSTACCRYLAPAYFGTTLDRFLSSDKGSVVQDALHFGKGGTLKSCYFRAHHVDLANSEQMVAALEDTEAFTRRHEGSLPGMYVTASWYVFYDQYRKIISELANNIMLCMAAVVAISAIVLVHPVNVLIVFSVLALVFWDLVGAILVWGLQLNSISMINLVMAIGLVVDYNMHIVHNFSIQDPSRSRQERAELAMEEMGPSVLLGIGSTFVAILPLGLAVSQVFRVFFYMLFSIIVVGGLHGLVLTPVVLSLWGQSLEDADMTAVKVVERPPQQPGANEAEADLGCSDC